MPNSVGFSQVRPVRSFEDIVYQIREAIFSGRLSQGDRLASERELCQTFNVSRATLREALRSLEAVGLVEIRLGSHGGVFVADPTGEKAGSAMEALIWLHEASARDLEEFRVSFEAETAQWAALRADTSDLETLKSLVDRIRHAVADETTPWSVVSDLDLEFHHAIAKASKNRVRMAVMLGVRQALERASRSIDALMTDDIRREIAEELTGIVQAIEQGDENAARCRMQAHVQRFSQLETSVVGEKGA